MVRTADNSLRVAGGKSTRKGGNVSTRQESTRSRSPSSGSGDKGGYNSVCPRETPAWQKPITAFFTAVDKSSHHKPNEVDKPGSSKNADDVNMECNLDEPQCSSRGDKQSIEAMDEEFHEVKIDQTENNKENETNSANVKQVSTDTEMAEFNGNAKKKINVRDDDNDDEVMAPPKKIKLDKVVYAHLHELEQS